MSGLPPIPAAPERKQPRLLLGRSVPNRKSSGVRKAPGPARSGWNSRSRPRTPIQPPPGPGSSAPPAPECTYASYTNPQHRQRVFWAGSSNSSTLPTRSVRNGPPNPTERESLGGVPHCRRFRPLSRQEPYSGGSMPHVGLVCRLGGVSAAREYFCTRGGGRGRPLGAEWPLKKEITRPAAARGAVE